MSDKKDDDLPPRKPSPFAKSILDLMKKKPINQSKIDSDEPAEPAPESNPDKSPKP